MSVHTDPQDNDSGNIPALDAMLMRMGLFAMALCMGGGAALLIAGL